MPAAVAAAATAVATVLTLEPDSTGILTSVAPGGTDTIDIPGARLIAAPTSGPAALLEHPW